MVGSGIAVVELLAAAASLAEERVTLEDMRMGFCTDRRPRSFLNAKEH